jgi:hypothetical protein
MYTMLGITLYSYEDQMPKYIYVYEGEIYKEPYNNRKANIHLTIMRYLYIQNYIKIVAATV